jgi:hypothetical protein
MPMLTLGDLNKDAVVVGVRVKHQGTTHKSLLLPKILPWIGFAPKFDTAPELQSLHLNYKPLSSPRRRY